MLEQVRQSPCSQGGSRVLRNHANIALYPSMKPQDCSTFNTLDKYALPIKQMFLCYFNISLLSFMSQYVQSRHRDWTRDLQVTQRRNKLEERCGVCTVITRTSPGDDYEKDSIWKSFARLQSILLEISFCSGSYRLNSKHIANFFIHFFIIHNCVYLSQHTVLMNFTCSLQKSSKISRVTVNQYKPIQNNCLFPIGVAFLC